MSAEQEVIEGEVEEPTVAALAIRDEDAGGIVRPAASIDDIATAFTEYEALKAKLLKAEDRQTWKEKGKTRSFVKRSGWRKLAIAFNVTFEIRDRIVLPKAEPGQPVPEPAYAEFVVRAIAPNGRFADGWGACSIDEPRFEQASARKKLHHDLPSTAETRAKNRAAADLFGMGDVSAEEMTQASGPEESQADSPASGPASGSDNVTTTGKFPNLPADGHAHEFAQGPRKGWLVCGLCGEAKKG